MGVATIAADRERARVLEDHSWTDSAADPSLVERVRQLEARLHVLRVSRRVLMNMLIQAEREHRARLTALESRNRRLARANARLAERVLETRVRAVRARAESREGFAPGVQND